MNHETSNTFWESFVDFFGVGEGFKFRIENLILFSKSQNTKNIFFYICVNNLFLLHLKDKWTDIQNFFSTDQMD